jgi:hypothetical protein
MATNIDKGIYQAPAGLDSMQDKLDDQIEVEIAPDEGSDTPLDPEALALIALIGETRRLEQVAKSLHGAMQQEAL